MSKAKPLLPALEHSWAVEAMIASYNHAYRAAHGSTYRVLGPVGVSDYGEARVASFQVEYLALHPDPRKVVRAIRKCDSSGRRHVLDVFHGTPSVGGLRDGYEKEGYEFTRTHPILGLDLPAPRLESRAVIRRVQDSAELEAANRELALEDEVIPPPTLADPQIHNFTAEWNGRIAGWTQLVTVFPGAGYIHQLYTLLDYRHQRIGTSLVSRVHAECERLGIPRVALIPSDMALGLYRRFGYRPLAYYSVFKPKDQPA